MIAHPYTQQHIDRFLAAPSSSLGIHGEAGTGKGYAAQYIVAQLVGANTPYIRVLDASQSKTGIDEVRALQKFLSLTVPGNASLRRAVIIEHLDELGHEAQNALLKTLEEPPADSIIIVTFARDTSILPTIHSRLQHIAVLPIDQATGAQALSTYDTAAYSKAFHMSGGNIGLLIALLEDQATHPLLQGIQTARELLALSRYQRLTRVDKLIKDSTVPPSHVLDGLYRLVNASYQQGIKTKSREEIQSTVQKLTQIEEAIADLDANVQAKLVLSRLFLEL